MIGEKRSDLIDKHYRTTCLESTQFVKYGKLYPEINAVERLNNLLDGFTLRKGRLISALHWVIITLYNYKMKIKASLFIFIQPT